LKRESRILLHVRIGDLDFIAVLRGSEGIEHLRILRGLGSVREIVDAISSEGFFGEVRYLVVRPPELSGEWRDALKRVGREDIEVDPQIRGHVEELIKAYSRVFEELGRVISKHMPSG